MIAKQMPLPGMAALEPRKKHQSGLPRTQRRRNVEEGEQTALFTFLRLHETRLPVLKWVFAVPNGLFTSPLTKSKAVDAGLTAGVWDIFVPFATVDAYAGEFCPGLWIEMKAVKNGLTAEQVEFEIEMKKRGYKTAICKTWYGAARVVAEYLGITDARFWKSIEVQGGEKADKQTV